MDTNKKQLIEFLNWQDKTTIKDYWLLSNLKIVNMFLKYKKQNNKL